MKILNIIFKNINSLKGSHHIDFTKPPFNTSPLFAITGPTGSGKSTLLDVISLALFNQVPRLGKISKKEILSKGALLTRNQKEASASVTYHCNAGTFTSSWSISTNKNNHLRDYEMEIADATGAILDIKKSKVPAHNEKLIGLNYDQFIKSVLLAQGEFAQFLKAKKDERGALLEKITGTGIYRELGRKAYERFKNEGLKIEKQQNEIQTHQSELLENEVHEDFTEKFKAKKENIAVFETQIKKLERDISVKDGLAKTKKEITAAEEKQSIEKKKMDGFLELSGAVLSKHERLRPIADELRLWSSLQDRLTELDKQLADLLERRNINEEGLTDLLNTSSVFIGKKTNREQAPKDIVGFSETIKTLQKKRSDGLAEFSKLKAIISEQAQDTFFKYDAKADNLGNLAFLASESQKNLLAFSKHIVIKETETITLLQEQTKKKLSRSQQLEKKDITIKQEEKNLLHFTTEVEKIEALQNVLPKEIELAEAKAKRFDAEVNTLRQSLEIKSLRASLEEHRAKLNKGEPCPLCGSLDHPFAMHLPKDLNTKNALETLQQEAKKWNAIYTLKKSELEKLKERKKELQGEITSVSEKIKKLIAQEEKLSEGIALPPSATWESFTVECQKQLDTLIDFEKEKKLFSVYEKLRPNLIQLKNILQLGKETKAQLDQKYSGKDIDVDTRQLLTQWTERKKELLYIGQQLQEVNAEADTKRKESLYLEKRLQASDNLAGFDTMAQAQKSLLDERTFNRLQAEKSEIVKAINNSDTTIKLLQKHFEVAKKKEGAETLEQLQDHFKTKQSELVTTREEMNELERALTNHKIKTEKITALKQQIVTEEKQIKRWKLLNELIGDAQGKRFNDFAQDLTLQNLVILANVRLADLSDRYRLDTPTEDEDDGLIVLDDHMGSQRRSVRTLSGGETFLLSLSMALALSDLASNNVEINSLFIDEGFGTLDPETLDQTLDTLEKLQSESSKTIGIISHVDSLKERIATQIQLERNGQGYSSLKIV